MSRPFKLSAPYKPRGDQPAAIEGLERSLRAGDFCRTLLGVTGSGKTFTVANVIERVQRPALVVTHNKTLAAQLYAEFKGFFPDNAVEYFVSYFDYYQPEAYLPQTDTYIEKDSSINDEIERLRLAATSSLLTRRDVVIVASVSCLYGLGSPEDYESMVMVLRKGLEMDRQSLLRKMVDMQYNRNDMELTRGHFRARGDVVEVCPSNSEKGVRVELFGDVVERLTVFDPLTGDEEDSLETFTLFPAKHFVTSPDKLARAIAGIKAELEERLQVFEKDGKLLEAQRIKMRTTYDIEMMQEMGYCSGIENYSRHLTGRAAGTPPYTLLDFFPEDFLTVIDESHATVPQLNGMYAGDRSRKTTLVEHGFRLPSALDNRPLTFEEFCKKQKQLICVSATPGDWEVKQNPEVIELIIRPTGLLDPPVTVKPLKGQIDDLIARIRERTARQERALVMTLTKRTAEDLTDYLRDLDIRVRYLHSEVDTIERVEILRSLRKAEFDVLVGINLLREGLDLPEVSMVAILDADKQGFLRSTRSLIQIAGRAARHVNGGVILYADVMTDAIKTLQAVTEYRRGKQQAYNQAHGVVPKSVFRAIEESLAVYEEAQQVEVGVIAEAGGDFEMSELIYELEDQMEEASKNLEFERAAVLRDQIASLRDKGTLKVQDSKCGIQDPEAKPRKTKSGKRGTRGKTESGAAGNQDSDFRSQKTQKSKG
ncbi:MAG: excinuclease ABC subunit UvrB [Verrucomicrobiae bacterium]|nr:excinuclease ABC subunit UvrB [Verrucomicrobiae bacterium]